jgi:CMP-N-acetylneuraminic acid synthetase
MQPFLGWDPLRQRSQDLPPAYALNGAIYVLPPALLRSGAPLLQPGTRPFPMADAGEALDIDTEDDWQVALALADAVAAGPA